MKLGDPCRTQLESQALPCVPFYVIILLSRGDIIVWAIGISLRPTLVGFY